MNSLRVIVFNADESFQPSLRSTLTSFDTVRIVAEVDEPAMLPHVVKQFAAEVLILHLDPSPECVLPIAGEVATNNPQIAVFAVSESTDGQLILSVMRRGFREFITKPMDRGILSDALSKVANQAEERRPSGRLISVLGTAGGVGATSIATNLAVELKSISGGNVTVVDLDYRFGQVATLLDVSPTYTIADLAQSPEQLEHQVIERALVEHASGVQVLSRPAHFVQSDNITAANCVAILTNLAEMNDYVVVDGPNRYDVGASAILDITDTMLMIIQLMVPSVRNAQRIIQGMREAGFNLDRTKLICNRVGKESGPLTQTDVEATLDKKIFSTIPDDWTAVSAAVNLGEPLSTLSPRTKVRMAIRELAENIHTPDGHKGDEREGGRKNGHLFSRMFSEA